MRSFIFLLLLPLLVATGSMAHGAVPKVLTDTVGVFSTMDGEVTYMFREVSMTQESVTYWTEKNRQKTQAQKKIKWMIVYNRVFLCLPRKSKGRDLQLMEVLATNDKYVLVQYWFDWYHYFIFDHKGNMKMEETKVFDRGVTIGSKKNNQKVLSQLRPYFSKCDALMDAMKANFDNKEVLSKGIVNILCQEAPPLPEILQALNEKPWYHK